MASVTAIAQKLAELENSHQPFKDINPNIHAIDFLEETVEESGGYPIIFHFLSEFWQSPKATGVRGNSGPASKNPTQYQFRKLGIAIMVGLNSNKVRDLTLASDPYIEALQAFQLRYYNLEGLVENSWLDDPGEMRPWKFHEAEHYGIVAPLTVMYRSRYQVGG